MRFFITFKLLLVSSLFCFFSGTAFAEHPCEASLRQLQENGTEVYSSERDIAHVYCALGFNFEQLTSSSLSLPTLVAKFASSPTYAMHWLIWVVYEFMDEDMRTRALELETKRRMQLFKHSKISEEMIAAPRDEVTPIYAVDANGNKIKIGEIRKRSLP